jgi:hypothetical protein
VLRIRLLVPTFQLFSFLLMLRQNKLEWFVLGNILQSSYPLVAGSDKHANLQYCNIIYCRKGFVAPAQGLYSQHFIFFVTYEWAQ